MELLLAERKLSTWNRKLCLTNIERRIFKPSNFWVKWINDKITHLNILFWVIFNVHLFNSYKRNAKAKNIFICRSKIYIRIIYTSSFRLWKTSAIFIELWTSYTWKNTVFYIFLVTYTVSAISLYSYFYMYA